MGLFSSLDIVTSNTERMCELLTNRSLKSLKNMSADEMAAYSGKTQVNDSLPFVIAITYHRILSVVGAVSVESLQRIANKSLENYRLAEMTRQINTFMVMNINRCIEFAKVRFIFSCSLIVGGRIVI